MTHDQYSAKVKNLNGQLASLNVIEFFSNAGIRDSQDKSSFSFNPIKIFSLISLMLWLVVAGMVLISGENPQAWQFWTVMTINAVLGIAAIFDHAEKKSADQQYIKEIVDQLDQYTPVDEEAFTSFWADLSGDVAMNFRLSLRWAESERQRVLSQLNEVARYAPLDRFSVVM